MPEMALRNVTPPALRDRLRSGASEADAAGKYRSVERLNRGIVKLERNL
jgi:hypothetical protein